MKTALIIINGELPDPTVLNDCRDRADTIICADGGANRALLAGIQPDLIVGDFDSLRAETRDQLREAEYLYRPSQYATDYEKTLQVCVERQFQRVEVVGMTGFRLDHQICNLHMSEKFSAHVSLEIHDNFGVGRFLIADHAPQAITLSTVVGQHISLFAFRRAEGILTEGLKYPLHHEALEWAVRDGLSNEATATRVRLSLKKGSLFIYQVRSQKAPTR